MSTKRAFWRPEVPGWRRHATSDLIIPGMPVAPPATDFNNWTDSGSTTVYSASTQDTSLYRPLTSVADQQAWAATADLGSDAARQEWANALIVPLQTTGPDFLTNLTNTVNAASGPCVVQLPYSGGTHLFTAFNKVGGASVAEMYASGFYNGSKFRGFRGAGPDKSFVGMAANSMTVAQINYLKTLDPATFTPNQMNIIRIDGWNMAHLNLGVTFCAADQNPLSGSLANVTQPQPAPHQGVNFYGSSSQPGVGYISHCRGAGVGKAWTSAPPFEHANFTSSHSTLEWYKVETDGRRLAMFDSTRRAVCGPVMLNNEYKSTMNNWYQHHCNVSRYALNDENDSTHAPILIINGKSEHISDILNYGNGGFTNATGFGFETFDGYAKFVNPYISQDNLDTSIQIAHDYQLTRVGGRTPVSISGTTKFEVIGGTYNNAWSQLNGIPCFRITTGSNHWYTNTYADIYVYGYSGGPRFTPWVYNDSSWPPTAAQVAAAGSNIYLVRNS